MGSFHTTSLLPRGLSANSASRTWVLQTRVLLNGVGGSTVRLVAPWEKKNEPTLIALLETGRGRTLSPKSTSQNRD